MITARVQTLPQASHPVLARGKGYVRLLMAHCAEQMATEGYHLSVLGGIRQRYGYFGFEKCGRAATYHVNRSNVKRCAPPGLKLNIPP